MNEFASAANSANSILLAGLRYQWWPMFMYRQLDIYMINQDYDQNYEWDRLEQALTLIISNNN